MGTQDPTPSSYFGTFQNTKELTITGGNFAINHHDTINRESNTDSDIKKLYSRISTAALHTSLERAEEVPETELKNIVNEWSSRLRTLSTTTPTESPLPFSSTFDRLSTDAALYDIFNWLYDPFTSSSVVWMHGSGNTRTQALLLANALAHILHQHRLLSASYFFSASTDNASVVPTIAYQLAQNITQAKVPIARAVDRNLAVFTSRCHDQVEQLIVNPLRNASELSPNEFFEAPKVIIIYGLEDYNDKNNFQTSFLDSLTRAVVELEITHFPQKLLVLGQHTDRLQECFLSSASQSKIVQRPIQVHNLLEKEHETCRKEKEIEKWDKALANKEKRINARVEALRRELRSQEAQMEERTKQRSKELEERERALRCREEEVVSQEQELKKREAEMEDTTRRRDEALGSREQAVIEREGASQGREEKIANQEQDLKKKWEDMKDREGALGLREPAAAEREGVLRRREDKVANQEQDLKKWDDMGDTTRRRRAHISADRMDPTLQKIDRLPSDTHSSVTLQQYAQPQLNPTPHERYTSDSKLRDRNLMTGLSPEFCSTQSPSTSASSPSSSLIVEHDHRMILPQGTDSYGIPLPPPSPAIQAAISNSEFTWKADEDGVVVAGTLEGLVQFLVITIDSQRHKDYRNIFSMACAEVATPDELFQIIARRLNDAKDEVSADVRFNWQHNAFLVIEHWLKLGYFPSNPNLRWTMKSLCEHAIQSKSEAARLYGVTKLQQLADQIMGPSTSPGLMEQGGIPSANLEPHSLAVVLSLLEGENYQALRPLDYVLYLTKNMSENVNKFYETNEKIKLWVTESILQYDDVHRRAEVMTYFIKTALECRDMRNLSSAIAIISALYSAAIQGLRVTKKSLTRDKQGKLITLHQLVNSDSDYRGYWDTLKSAPTAEKKGICIPWLKVHLIELQKALSKPVTIQEEGQHLINLERYTTFMARSKELMDYTPPSVGDHRQGEQFKHLLAQLRTITFLQGTDKRLLARSTILQGHEVSNRRSRKDKMSQLGFQS